MIGQTISHYKILEKLGEGGMGVVYKAEDTKLKRLVALKFLPQYVTKTEEGHARFLQEAQAAATLNHPNVCAIHTIEEHGGQQFIDMEYVDGETLRSKLHASTLKTGEAITYALQIGEALQEAHSQGIVHRDVKPDNLMVNSKNQIKVMDFGLSKLKGSLKLTRTSSTMGTLAYMAPEQIQGGEVDSRSDIFSFGVVLFEMLTGHSPFRGEHEAAMVYSIVNEDPDSLTKYLVDASSELTHILGRALEKDPEDRYQTVHDMVIDLRRLKKETSKVFRSAVETDPPPASTSVRQERAISATVSHQQNIPTTSVTINIPRMTTRSFLWPGVVLGVMVLAMAGYFVFLKPASTSGEHVPIVIADFVNETKEPELDGLSGMLITALEQSRRLDVLPRARMFDILKLLGKSSVERVDESLAKEICNQAGITSLLTASIRKFGKVYTIDMKVLDLKGGKYLFTATETGEGQESIPSLLDKLSKKTREDFKENRTEIQSASKNVAAVTTSNLEAYQHFFRGEELINKLKFKEAEEEFKQAAALDSTFGLAYYRLAYAISWQRGNEDLAKVPIQRAVALLDRIPEREKYLVRAVNVQIDEGMRAGIAILREMQQLYPNDKEMLYNLGDWSFHEGEYDTAAVYLGKILTMDATNERALQHLAWTYRDMKQFNKMLEIAQRYLSAFGSEESYTLVAQAYRRLGDYDAGLNILRQAQVSFPGRKTAIAALIATHYIHWGKFEEAEAEINKTVSDVSSPPSFEDQKELFRSIGWAYSNYDDGGSPILGERYFRRALALRTESKDIQILHDLGWSLLNQHKSAEAAEFFLRGHTLAPRHFGILVGLYFANADLKNFGQVIEYADKMHKIIPTGYEFTIGAYALASQFPKADSVVENLLASLTKVSEKQAVLIEAGGAYNRGKTYEKSRQYYKRALALDPETKRADLFAGLGSIALHQMNFVEAVELFMKGLAIDSTHEWCLRALVEIGFARNDYAMMERYAHQYYRTFPVYVDKRTLEEMFAWMEHSRKNDRAAEQRLWNLLAVDSTCAFAYAGLSNLFIDRGRFKDALTYAHKALALDSGFRTYRLMAHILLMIN